MPEARFAAVLEDQTSGAASSVTASMQRMKAAITGDLEQIKALQAAMRNLKGPGAQNAAQFSQMSDQLTALKANVQANTSKFLGLGGSAADLAGKAGPAADSLKAIMGAAKGVGGPMGGLFEKFELLKGAFTGGAGAAAGWAAAVVAVVVVVAAAVTAIASLVYQMAEYALTVGSAAIKTQAVMEALTGSAGAAAGLQGSIARVAGQVPIAADQVSKLAQDLYKSGKRGTELEDALFKASMAAAGLGKNVVKGSAAARKAMLPLDVQTLKFKEHIATIFSGVNVTPFLEGLQDVIGLFDDSTSSGKALKAIVETMLNPLFDGAAAAFPYVKMGFRGMVVGALLVAIAVLRVKNVLRDTFGGSDILSGIDGMQAAFYVGVAAAILFGVGLAALAIVIGILAAALAVCAFAMLLFMAPFIIGAIIVGAVFVAAILLVVAAVYGLIALWNWAGDAIASVDMGAIGANMMSSLANAISSGASWVLDALTSLASQMGSTIKSALGIASPSKLFASMGEFTALGMAVGIESETPAVAGALESMVTPPAMQEMAVAGAQAAQGGSDGGKVSITIPFAYAGASKAEESQQRGLLAGFCEVLEVALEEAGIDASLAVA